MLEFQQSDRKLLWESCFRNFTDFWKITNILSNSKRQRCISYAHPKILINIIDLNASQVAEKYFDNSFGTQINHTDPLQKR